MVMGPEFYAPLTLIKKLKGEFLVFLEKISLKLLAVKIQLPWNKMATNDVREVFKTQQNKIENSNLTKKEKIVIWLIDTGATSHMCNDETLLLTYKTYDDPRYARTANGKKVEIKGEGTVKMHIRLPNNITKIIVLEKVLYIPILMMNLISAGKLAERGFRMRFSLQGCSINGSKGEFIMATCNQGSFNLTGAIITEINTTIDATKVEKSLWVKGETQEIINPKLKTPKDWKDVLKLPENEQSVWIKAMNEELDTFHNNDIWTECYLPSNAKTLSSRWTYKLKRNREGNIACARARLVARGCFQREGIDFDETYAPVVSHATIRAMLVITTQRNYTTMHCDIKSAFLYGDLEEDIYLQSPPGPWKELEIGKCYQLNRAIYGLKQAAHAWHIRIHQSLTSFGLKQGLTDPCLYHYNEKGITLLLIIHVDDLLLSGNSKAFMNNLIDNLSVEYGIKNLGEVYCYLGININIDYNKKMVIIDQEDKVKELVQDMKLLPRELSNLPMSTDYLQSRSDPSNVLLSDNVQFQQMVGSLMYLGVVSRPDILLSSNLMGRVVSQPNRCDWREMKKIFKYLQKTMKYKLYLKCDKDLTLTSYSDADWGGDHSDRKSTSGQVHLLGGAMVHWITRKQKSVSLSTAQAEYVALSATVLETLWLGGILQDLLQTVEYPIDVLSDNQAAIHIGNSSSKVKLAKHIDMRYHHIRDEVSKNRIKLIYCPGEDMLADSFTKPLPSPRFENLMSKLGLKNEDRDGDID